MFEFLFKYMYSLFNWLFIFLWIFRQHEIPERRVNLLGRGITSNHHDTRLPSPFLCTKWPIPETNPHPPERSPRPKSVPAVLGKRILGWTGALWSGPSWYCWAPLRTRLFLNIRKLSFIKFFFQYCLYHLSPFHL